MIEELPEELTIELLSLVLSTHVGWLDYNPQFNDTIRYYKNYPFPKMPNILNIDTLTRLMKEWCFDKGYILTSNIETKMSGSCMVVGNDLNPLNFTTKTEFEAVLKATHWVAKEKGEI